MTAPRQNPLVSDRDVAFQLYEVLDAQALCALPGVALYLTWQPTVKRTATISSLAIFVSRTHSNWKRLRQGFGYQTTASTLTSIKPQPK